MKVIHAREPLAKSLFLAGPTPRDNATPSWRPEALRLLREKGFDGTVFVPEQANWAAHSEYDAQVDWEWEALNQATVVVFWVPRNLSVLPAFTTNVEFGLLAASSKIVLGFPPATEEMRYLARLAIRYQIPVAETLEATLDFALDKLAAPFTPDAGALATVRATA